MFARITALHFQPENAEQGFDIVQHAIVPTIKEQGAFKGLLLLRDPVTGTRNCRDAVGLRGGMQASASGNYPIQLAKVSELLSGQPTRHIYEVKEVSLSSRFD